MIVIVDTYATGCTISPTVYDTEPTPTGGTQTDCYAVSDTAVASGNEYYEFPEFIEKEVKPIPGIEWKQTPARSIKFRPEYRIKQPVSRTGFKRGQRV